MKGPLCVALCFIHQNKPRWKLFHHNIIIFLNYPSIITVHIVRVFVLSLSITLLICASTAIKRKLRFFSNVFGVFCYFFTSFDSKTTDFQQTWRSDAITFANVSLWVGHPVHHKLTWRDRKPPPSADSKRLHANIPSLHIVIMLFLVCLMINYSLSHTSSVFLPVERKKMVFLKSLTLSTYSKSSCQEVLCQDQIIESGISNVQQILKFKIRFTDTLNRFHTVIIYWTNSSKNASKGI